MPPQKPDPFLAKYGQPAAAPPTDPFLAKYAQPARATPAPRTAPAPKPATNDAFLAKYAQPAEPAQPLTEPQKRAREVAGAAKGLALGAADVGGRIMGSLGWLAEQIPGATGEGLADYVAVRNQRLKARQSTGAEKIGRIAGNIVGEGAVALTGGNAVGGVIRAAAPASRVARAIAAGRQGSLGQRVIAQTAPFLPMEAALGAGGNPNDPLKGAAINTLFGLGGAGILEGATSGARAIARSPVTANVAREARLISRKAYIKLLDQDFAARVFGRDIGGSNQVSHEIDRISGARAAGEQQFEGFLRATRHLFRGQGGRNRENINALAGAERVIELANNGAKDVTPQQLAGAQQAVALLSQDQNAVAGAAALQTEYRRLMQMKLREGVISQEQFDAMATAGIKYTPLIPEWAVEAGANTEGTKSFFGGRLVAGTPGVRRFRSRILGTTPTVDLLEQLAIDTQRAHHLVAKQRVTNVVADIVENNPAASAGWIEQINAEDAGRFSRVVRANVGGEQRTYRVVDEELYKTLTTHGPSTQGLIGKILGGAKTVLRTGVTYMPDFMIANATRDAVHVATQYGATLRNAAGGAAVGAGVGAAVDKDDRLGGALKGGAFGLSGGILAPSFSRTLRSMGEILDNAPVYQEFVERGGLGFSEFYGDRAGVRRMLNDALRDRTWRDSITMPLRGVRDGYMLLGQAVEQAPRLARYKAAVRDGASPAEAVSLAKDISVNFANIGSSSTVKALSSSTAFLNANLQGWDKMIRMMRNPKTAGIAAALITAPSVALWYVNKDDPEYHERPVWERSMFWLVPKGEGGFYRIPKPFELGFLFATVPEMLLSAAYGKDPEGVGRSVASHIKTQVEGFIPTTTLLRPMAEHLANKSLFTGYQVKDDSKTATEQFDDRTSQAAVEAGQATGTSPQVLEHYTRGYLGTAGGAGLTLADKLLPGREVGGERGPAVENKMVIGQRFVTTKTQQPESERRLREKMRKAEVANSSLQRAEKDGASETRLARIRQRYARELADYDAPNAKKQRSVLQNAAKERRRTRFDRNLPTSEKTRRMVELNNAVLRMIHDPDNFDGLPNW